MWFNANSRLICNISLRVRPAAFAARSISFNISFGIRIDTMDVSPVYFFCGIINFMLSTVTPP